VGLRPGPDALRLEAAIRAGQPVLFSVPVPRLRLVGEKLGAWLLAECNRVASRLTATDWGRKTGRRCLVLVDEFAGLREQGAHAAEPLATVREGGVSVWLFTQTWSDLERLGDDTRSQIVGNTDVQIVFRQAEAHDQQAWSAQLGGYETQRFSRSLDGETGEATGNFRVRSAAAPYVRPGDLAALGVGQAYVRIGSARPVAARFPIPRTAERDDPDAEPEDDDGTPSHTPPAAPGAPPALESPLVGVQAAVPRAAPDDFDPVG
jgi:type IV secretory pathway TraG/TraD family ATPase VirD4